MTQRAIVNTLCRIVLFAMLAILSGIAIHRLINKDICRENPQCKGCRNSANCKLPEKMYPLE